MNISRPFPPFHCHTGVEQSCQHVTRFCSIRLMATASKQGSNFHVVVKQTTRSAICFRISYFRTQDSFSDGSIPLVVQLLVELLLWPIVLLHPLAPYFSPSADATTVIHSSFLLHGQRIQGRPGKHSPSFLFCAKINL